MNESYTGWDRITAERLEDIRKRQFVPDLFASLSDIELCELLRRIADIFARDHPNRAAIEEAAARLEGYDEPSKVDAFRHG
jgi:hypothetical protein